MYHVVNFTSKFVCDGGSSSCYIKKIIFVDFTSKITFIV